MAKSLSKNRQELFYNLLATAKKSIIAGGISNLTARGLSKEVGCAVGSIYNVFTDIDDLILHINAETLESLCVHMQTAANKYQGTNAMGRAYLLSLTSAYMDFTTQNKELWHLLFEHRLPKNRELPPNHLEKIQFLLSLISHALTPYFDDDEEEDRALAAAALWSSMHGIRSLSMSQKLSFLTPTDEMKIVTILIDPYIAGLESRRAAMKNTKPSS